MKIGIRKAVEIFYSALFEKRNFNCNLDASSIFQAKY